MKFIVYKMQHTHIKAFQWDRYQRGDLYAMSYLKNYNWPIGDYSENAKKISDTTKIIDLSIIGDSFLEKMKAETADSALYGARLKFFCYPAFQISKPHNVELISERKNILLIEVTERNIRDYFSNTRFVNVINTGINNSSFNKSSKKIDRALQSLTNIRLVPTVVDRNIETVIFGYKMFTPLKELKSELNFNLFHRNDPLVFVSDNQKNLYLATTIDPDSVSSSFKPVSDIEIDSIVSNLNYISDRYKKKGFDEVVFCMVPNPVTIIEPLLYKYNELIPRIQKNKNLKVPMIDVYSAFKEYSHPDSLYFQSDTHWNSIGFNIWAGKMNGYLKLYISDLNNP